MYAKDPSIQIIFEEKKSTSARYAKKSSSYSARIKKWPARLGSVNGQLGSARLAKIQLGYITTYRPLKMLRDAHRCLQTSKTLGDAQRCSETLEDNQRHLYMLKDQNLLLTIMSLLLIVLSLWLPIRNSESLRYPRTQK